MAESLVDLILLAPEAQQGQMLAEAISQVGVLILGKRRDRGGIRHRHLGGVCCESKAHL